MVGGVLAAESVRPARPAVSLLASGGFTEPASPNTSARGTSAVSICARPRHVS